MNLYKENYVPQHSTLPSQRFQHPPEAPFGVKPIIQPLCVLPFDNIDMSEYSGSDYNGGYREIPSRQRLFKLKDYP
jgi:hypothetical protein